MQKTAFKAFVCSFSVSMLAFSVAAKALLHKYQDLNSSVTISNKNIALFVKNLQTYRHPVKKIDLNVLADATPSHDILDLSDSNYGAYDDIIVADEAEYIAIPPKEEISVAINDTEPPSESINTKIVEEKVVYAENLPVEQPLIEEKAIYSPDEGVVASVVKPPHETEAEENIIYAGDEKEKLISTPPPKLAQENSSIPLVFEKSRQTKEVTLGDPENMNHVAMAAESASIESMAKKIDNIPQEKPTENWQPMNNNPWVVAKANGVNRNQLADKLMDDTNSEASEALNIHKPKSGVEVAAETVKNLIIPLPEKLANDDKLMPKLAYPISSDDAKKEKVMNAISLREEAEKEQQALLTEIEDDDDVEMTPIPTEDKEEVKEDTKDKSVLSALGELLSSKTKEATETVVNAISKVKTRASARSAVARAAKANRQINISPKEIRMSFQPNKAEISGQTLRWVQAFATKAAKEENMSLEVRIDGSRPSILQQRRLNMLYNILTNKGVEYSKIHVVFTAREPNSFILRMINSNSKEQKNSAKINKYGNNHLQW